MKFVFILFIGVCLSGFPAVAQVKSDQGQLLLNPPMVDPANADGSRCFNLINKAPYTVNGSMNTDYYDLADGGRGRAHRNFRLRPGGETRLCSFGPFYPGARLELVLRTLVPIFSCYTVAQGDIVIFGEIKPEGGTRTWVDCQ
jgi:hypothetical protein